MRKLRRLIIGIALASLIFSKGLTVIFEEKEYVEIEVQNGESLWTIAAEWSPKSKYDTKTMVNWIIEKNYKWDTVIYPGDVLMIPIEQKDIQLAFK